MESHISTKRKQPPAVLQNLKLEPVGAAIRLVSDGCDSPVISPSRRVSLWDDRLDDDEEENVPWSSSYFINKLRDNSTASVHNQIRKKSYDRAMLMEEKDLHLGDEPVKHDEKEEEEYLKQLSEFDKLRLKFDQASELKHPNPYRNGIKTGFHMNMDSPSSNKSGGDGGGTSNVKKAKEESCPLDGPASPPTQPSSVQTTTTTISALKDSAPIKDSTLKPPPSGLLKKRHSIHKQTDSGSSATSEMSVSSSILFANNTTTTGVAPSSVGSGGSSSGGSSPNTPTTHTAASSANTSPASVSSSVFSEFTSKQPLLTSRTIVPNKLEKLQRQVDALQDKSRILRRELALVEPSAKNPYKVEPEVRAKVKAQYEQLRGELESVERAKYDLGVKLTRAWKRHRDHGGGGTDFWVNKVNS